MKQNTLKIAGLALAAAFATITAKADIAVHQNVSLYGYAAGALSYDKPNNTNSDTDMDLTAAKLGLAFNFAPVTGKISLYTDKGAHDLYVLEANATYDVGNGLTITGGRFQSYVGYEAFDIPNQNFLTNGNEFAGLIPNFHEGIKAEYAMGKSSFGVAFVDSIFNGDNKYSGNSDMNNGYGMEAHYGYNDGALSVSVTLGYQNGQTYGNVDAPLWTNAISFNNLYLADIWAQYVIKQTTLGAEFYYVGTTGYGYRGNTYYGLAMVKQQMSEKFTLAGRFSVGEEKDFGDFWKVSATPAYEITKNLSVAAELNYTKYSHDFRTAYNGDINNAKSKVYVGVQAVFKF